MQLKDLLKADINLSFSNTVKHIGNLNITGIIGTIGAVYERLIEDVEKVFTAKSLIEIYNSWISDAISNYNTDFYYQSRDYIRECYLAGKII